MEQERARLNDEAEVDVPGLVTPEPIVIDLEAGQEFEVELVYEDDR